MSETKHTKGKWEIDNRGTGMCRIQVNPDNPIKAINICSLSGNGEDEEIKANAKLIAAAPDMLEALKYSLGYIQGYLELQGHEQKVIDNVTEIIKYAIQKAEGK